MQTAKADKEKAMNEAQSYSNDVLPRARGEAFKMLSESESYKEEVIARAKGDVSRFNAIYYEYMQNKEVTKNRMYLDTMQEILRSANKVIIGTDGLLPHMQIGDNGFTIK